MPPRLADSRAVAAALGVAMTVLAAAQFFAYSFFRTFGGDTPMRGFDLSFIIVGTAASVVLISPLLLGTIFASYRLAMRLMSDLPRRRRLSGLCPRCGYPVAAGDRCPECGTPPGEPDDSRAAEQVLSRWLCWACVLAILTGTIAAETRVLADQAVFRWEAAARAGPYHRARWWPNRNSSLHFEPGRGYWSID